MASFNLPKFSRVDYVFNPASSHYQKKVEQPEKFPIASLPFELKREITRGQQIIPNAKECLTKNERKKDNGSRVMFTGLQTLSRSNWYIGDTCCMNKGKKIKSLLIIHFYDNGEMQIYYFPKYFKFYPDDRHQFALSFISYINNQYSLVEY